MDQLFLFTVFLGQLSQSIGKLCPVDLVTEVSACFINLTGSAEHVMAGADVEQLLNQCRKGHFSTTVQCIERLYALCPHDNDQYILKQMASPDYMRKSFRFFCSNFDHYANSSRCIRSLDNEINYCVNAEIGLLHSRIQTQKQFQDYLPLYCKYLHGTTRCIEKPVRRQCDGHTADIIVVFADGMMPPVCDRYTSKGNVLRPVFQATLVIVVLVTLTLI